MWKTTQFRVDMLEKGRNWMGGIVQNNSSPSTKKNLFPASTPLLPGITRRRIPALQLSSLHGDLRRSKTQSSS